MKTKILTICLLLSTFLVVQGDIYSCRKIIRAGGLNGPSFMIKENFIIGKRPILIIVKNLFIKNYILIIVILNIKLIKIQQKI